MVCKFIFTSPPAILCLTICSYKCLFKTNPCSIPFSYRYIRRFLSNTGFASWIPYRNNVNPYIIIILIHNDQVTINHSLIKQLFLSRIDTILIKHYETFSSILWAFCPYEPLWTCFPLKFHRMKKPRKPWFYKVFGDKRTVARGDSNRLDDQKSA